VWADLGCGDGIFTAALCTLVSPGGEIYAVDRDPTALRMLALDFDTHYPGTLLHTLLADFARPLTLPALDGIVMANALHFIRDKAALVIRLMQWLKPKGRFIVVEYNTRRANPAVPHPLDEAGFLELAHEAGLRQPRILSRIPSTFLGEMYAGMGFAGRRS
jgi:trans-aconitate methyltransferase